jgi:hypothetical protein
MSWLILTQMGSTDNFCVRLMPLDAVVSNNNNINCV